MSTKIITKTILLISLSILLYSCCSSNYINVKVRKSAFIPDTYELNRDSLITGGIVICKKAQRYFHKPKIKGGGENSFIGFFIPPYLDTTSYGVYQMSVNKKLIKIIGIGKSIGYDNYRPMHIEIIASPNNILSTNINN